MRVEEKENDSRPNRSFIEVIIIPPPLDNMRTLQFTGIINAFLSFSLFLGFSSRLFAAKQEISVCRMFSFWYWSKPENYFKICFGFFFATVVRDLQMLTCKILMDRKCCLINFVVCLCFVLLHSSFFFRVKQNSWIRLLWLIFAFKCRLISN